MAGLNFLVRCCPSSAVFFHIDPNDQNYADQDWRFVSRVSSSPFLVKFRGRFTRAAATSMPMLTGTEDYQGTRGFCPWLHAHLPAPQRESQTFQRRRGDPGSCLRQINTDDGAMHEPDVGRIRCRRLRSKLIPSTSKKKFMYERLDH